MCTQCMQYAGMELSDTAAKIHAACMGYVLYRALVRCFGVGGGGVVENW